VFEATVAGSPVETVVTPLMSAQFLKNTGEKISNLKIAVNGASVKLNSLSDMNIPGLKDTNINIEVKNFMCYYTKYQ